MEFGEMRTSNKIELAKLKERVNLHRRDQITVRKNSFESICFCWEKEKFSIQDLILKKHMLSNLPE